MCCVCGMSDGSAGGLETEWRRENKRDSQLTDVIDLARHEVD